MRKELSVGAVSTNIKKFVAFVMIAAMIICAVPNVPFTAQAALGDANDGIDLDTVFKKNSGIYLGTYTHTITKNSSNNDTTEPEGSANPILWEVNELSEDKRTVTLTSKYILALIEKDYILSTLNNFYGSFSAAEQSIIESVFLLNSTDTNHFGTSTTSYYPTAYRKAYLKNGSLAVNWLVANGSGDYSYAAGSNGAINDNLSGDALYGFRPSITISVDNIVYASTVTESSNGYTKSTGYYKLTLLDSASLQNLSLTNLKTDSESLEDIPDQSLLEVNINGTLNLTAIASNGGSGYAINYKIIDNNFDTTNTDYGKIVKYATAQGSPAVDNSSKLAVRSAGLKSGDYNVHLWLQKNETKNSHTASPLVTFILKVTTTVDPVMPEIDWGASSNSDFGIVVDYYNEVIRIVSSSDLGSKSYLEAATYEQAEAYKLQAERFYANNGDNVMFMYCLKAASTDSMSEDKKVKAYLSEKWYPIYGNTVDIVKALPKSAKSGKPYCVAIRKVNDVFDLNKGYTTRQVVPLKPRNSDSQFKKLLKYDSEKQIYLLSSGSDMQVLYRMNYFPNPISATMSTDTTDSSKNIKVSADTFPLGGVLYISTMPTVSDGVVMYAASKQIKVTVPKKLAAPAAKVNTSSGKITSLKKSTTEFSYDGDTWTTYNGENSVDIIKVTEIFPNIKINNEDNYYLYFRTKATAKNPASESITLLLPKTLVNP